MKFEHVPDHILEMYEKIRSQHFPHLANAKILFLLNKKKMTYKGNIILSKIVKPSELVKILSKDERRNMGMIIYPLRSKNYLRIAKIMMLKEY